MKKIIYLVIICFAYSCTNDQKKEVSHTETNHADTAFDVFFEAFNKDSIYQKEHVSYPLTCIYTDMDRNMDTTAIMKNGWYYFNLLKEQGQYDKYELVYDRKGSETVVSQRGLDNGIHVVYQFQLEQGKWMLVKLEDSSN